MDAALAPHPFTNLMPDSEQSRDANERVCLQEGLQTTYSSGRIEFKGGTPSFRDKTPASSCFAPAVLQYRRKVEKKDYRYFYICLNYIKFPLFPPEAGTLRISADCKGGNNQSTCT